MLVWLLLALQDPADETEVRASAHLKAAKFIEKDADSLAEALYHYERVIDTCRGTTDEERLAARRGAHALHGRVPPNTEEAKAAKWRVLAIVPRSVNYRKVARYRVSDAAQKAIKKGFETFQKTVWDASRGWMKVEGTFVFADEEVRSLSQDDDGVWLHPDDLERNQFRARPKADEYDLVIVYLIGGEGLAFERDVRAEWFRGMRYVNYLWTEDQAQTNSGTGERELRALLWQFFELMPRRTGYRMPDPNAEAMRNDACYEGAKGDGADEHPWRRHFLEDHFTPQLLREMAARPQTPFLRAWLVSPRFDNRDDRGFDQAFVTETSDDLDTRGWELVQSKQDLIDLGARSRGNPRGVMYAATYLYSKKKQWVKLFLGEDASAKVFHDGTLVHSEHEHRGLEADRHCIRMLLHEGRNLLLIKVDNNQDEWGFTARVTDLMGLPPKVDIGPVRK